MTEYPRNTKEAFFPRSMKEAFGPYTDNQLEETHTSDWKDQTVLVASLIAMVLALVIVHVYPAV